MKALNRRKLLFVQALLLFVSLAMIFAGAYAGEVETVLRKAIYICMECIGLG